MKTKKAFTLVELLVVIAIIAMLMGILMPALRKAREQARMIVCRSNEKTLVMASMLWSNDHDDWAIAGDWWKPKGSNDPVESSLEGYTNANKGKENDSMVCPTARNIQFYCVDNSFNTSGNERTFTYAANGYITLNLAPFNEGSPGNSGPESYKKGSGNWAKLTGNNVYWDEHGVTKMSSIRRPAETVFFIDHEYYAAFSWVFDPTKDPETFPAGYWHKTRWHNKRPNDWYGVGNIGWVDGHVSLEPKDFADVDSKGKKRWKYYFYDH